MLIFYYSHLSHLILHSIQTVEIRTTFNNACVVKMRCITICSPFSSHLNTSTHPGKAWIHNDRFIQASVYVLDGGLQASWERLIPLTWELIREYNWMSCCNSHIQVTVLSAACITSDWMSANPAWTRQRGKINKKKNRLALDLKCSSKLQNEIAGWK